jgi:hypothetical protein
MPELETRGLKGVQIIDVGTWDASTGTFTVTDADLAAYVAAFDATKDSLKIPAKLGHDEGQRLLQQDGYPAAGWLERLYIEDSKLVGDFEKVPAKVADLIEARAYRNVSAEIWHDVTVGTEKFGSLLMGVAFLGEDIPACTTLKDVYELYGAKAALAAPPTSKPRPPVFASKVETVTIERKKLAARRRTGIRARIDEALHRLRDALGADASHEQVRQELQDAIDMQFAGGIDGYAPWIIETFDDHVIVQKGAEYWSIPYTRADDGTVTFGAPTPVEQDWVPETSPTPVVEDLTPTTTSASHIRAGITGGKDTDLAITKTLATALGIPETADEQAVLTAVTDLKGKNTTLEQRIEKLENDGKAQTAAAAVDGAIRAKKVAPANREGMLAFALADPKAFTAMLEKAPAILTGVAGSDGDAPPAKSAGDELNDHIVAAMKADPKLEWSAARAQVTRAHPDLARKYTEEQRGTAARLS